MTIYAEEVNYWKTSKSTPADKWMDDAIRLIDVCGGIVTEHGYMNQGGQSAFLLAFALGDDRYRIVWPVLPIDPSKKRTASAIEIDLRAARVQAATFLYHDVKAKCMSALVFGFRAAFVQFLVLGSGQTVGQSTDADVNTLLPRSFALMSGERG